MLLTNFRCIIDTNDYYNGLEDNENNNIFVAAPKYTWSKFGKPVIEMGPYRYYRRYQYKSKTKWVCIKYRSDGCPAAMTTTDEAIIAFQHSHNH
ncbi:hypothetical protein HF086_014293 [Spodoptera exigua]|uniref:FLYWCH-type domain-containing protein n=1 Tax=Spodoptera exigua TaxID=7107 RepID=A0A922M7K0_SPOEX|nr:hypothetical protein HF086_014293 [Spodoptera exigua]